MVLLDHESPAVTPSVAERPPMGSGVFLGSRLVR